MKHISSGNVVLLVHMVKGRQYSVYTVIDTGASIGLRLTLDVDSEIFQCFIAFNHRRQTQ